MRPKLLDLFCCAGGAGMGYSRAGFDVTGVDINPQPNYPFEFIQADAIDYVADNWDKFDAIHASPPCQKFSSMQHIHKNKDDHPDLIIPTIKFLDKINLPYVIENVVGAPLRIDLLLCGTMFGLPIAKHRIFTSNVPMPILTMTCKHENLYDPYHGGEMARGEREKLGAAIGVDWFMTRPEVREAIPPAYTEFIGKIIINYLKEN